MPGRTFDVIFIRKSQSGCIETSDGRVENIALRAMAVAEFFNEFMKRLHHLDIDIHIWTMPSASR